MLPFLLATALMADDAGGGWLGTDAGSLLGPARLSADATIREIEAPSKTSIVDAMWSEKGDMLSLLFDDGSAMRVGYPAGRARGTIQKGVPKGQWAGTKLGPAIIGAVEIGGIDEKEWAVRRRMALPEHGGVAAHSAWSVIFAATPDHGALMTLSLGETGAATRRTGVELEKGAKPRRHPHSQALRSFPFLAASPDGKFLFCASQGCLHRFAVTDNSLTYEEAGPSIATHPTGVVFSPDGRYVALPNRGGNHTYPDHPKRDGGVTFAYRTTDLQRPVLSLPAAAETLAFDPIGKRVLAAEPGGKVVAFDATGGRKHSYGLAEGLEAPGALRLRPRGDVLFALAGGRAWLLEFNHANAKGSQ